MSNRAKKALERAESEIGILHQRLELIQLITLGERICVVCGCSDNNACPEGCEWSLVHAATPTGVCSNCIIDYLAAVIDAEKVPEKKA